MTLLLAGILAAAGINAFVLLSTAGRIIKLEDAVIQDGNYVIVLGCGVWANGPSPMLEDRIITGVRTYEENEGIKLLMSGDHREDNYNEPGTMAEYAEKMGVDSRDIIQDRYGLSTYDSIYRAKELYGAEKIIIITQRYHLYRALYIAESLGMEAIGVASDLRNYGVKMVKYTIREWLARDKDFLACILRPQSEHVDY